MHDVLDILDLCMGGKGVSAFFILMFISYTRNSLKRWVFSLRSEDRACFGRPDGDRKAHSTIGGQVQ